MKLLRESGPLTSAEIAIRANVQIGTLRNVLTRLCRAQAIKLREKQGHAHLYEAIAETGAIPDENARAPQ